MVKTKPRYSRVDGGYGWVIVFGSFLTHFLLLGMVRSFGILYVALLRKFGESATKTASLSACFNTVRMLLGPLVSMLVKKTSCRLSMICGGILMMCGLVISAFAPSLDFLFLSYGILAGMGGALLFTPPYIIVGQYFDKKKGIAMALGTVGAGLGSAVMAPLMVFLLQHYSYYGCLMILGALALHNCVTGALFRPFHDKPTCETIAKIEEEKNNERMDSLSLTQAGVLETKPQVGLNETYSESENAERLSKCSGHIDEECLQKRITNNAKENCRSAENTVRPVSQQKSLSSKNIFQRFKKTLGHSLSLFRNTTMIIYCLCILCMPFAMGMVIFFIADAAVLVGASDSEAAFIMTCFGGCDVMGRLGVGLIFDLKIFRHRRRLLYAIVGMVVGTIVASVGLLSTYWGYFTITCVFGLAAGGLHSQRITIVSEFIPKDRLADIVGISIFFQGFGNLIGAPFGGFVRDRFGDYDLAFYVSGTSLFTISAFFLLDYIIKNSKQARTL